MLHALCVENYNKKSEWKCFEMYTILISIKIKCLLYKQKVYTTGFLTLKWRNTGFATKEVEWTL